MAKRVKVATGKPSTGSGSKGKSARPAKSARAAKTVEKAAFDPARAAASIGRIEAAAAKAGITLPRGASEKQIAAAEAKLGASFPPELRAFYLAHDGAPDDAMCGGRQLLSLKSIVNQWTIWKELFDGEELEDEGVEPDTGVQERWWIPAWIPVTYDFGGNHDVVDLAPAKRGKLGQVVAVWHDDGARTVEGDDFLSWLEDQTWGDEEAQKVAQAPALTAPSAWKPGPYVFVFQLGKNAKAGKTRVPAAYTTSPCYYYRSDKKSFGKLLGKIPEPEVEDSAIDITFAAIDAYVADNALRLELYSDEEIERGGKRAETRGFHAGATYEQTKEALAKGGFNVIDRLGPEGLGRDVDDLARHLDQSSLALVLKSLRGQVSKLFHAESAAWVLRSALDGGREDRLIEAILRVAPTWTKEMRERLIVLAAQAFHAYAEEACGGFSTDKGRASLATLRGLLAALPPLDDAAVRAQLQVWGVLDDGAAKGKKGGARRKGARG
jgi:cell wall assembly regulator SMI1